MVSRGHDAVHAVKVEIGKAPDTETLTKAREDSRVVVTADLDFPRILALTGAGGPAVILFRGGSYSEEQMRRLLDKVLAAVTASDIERSITVVDRTRIRRTQLPLSLRGSTNGGER